MTKLCIDLCAGLGGFSQAFKEASDWEVITVEINKKQKPTICADIRYLPLRENLYPDALLMSPPCERNSIACPQWPKKGIQKAMEIVGACLEAVVWLKPKCWLLENPKGRLRWFLGTPKQSIKYSHYDMEYKGVKLTDLWGNIPLPMVKNARVNKIGHYEKHWFHSYMGTNKGELSKIPKGVSQAVKQGVEISLLNSSEKKEVIS
jgi:hypothetical protein